MQPHFASLERCHAQLDELTRSWVDPWQVEQTKIISVLPMAADALVIIDKITAAVQDQLLAVDLDGPRMVRGMPMYKVDAAINEAVRKADLLRIDPIPPVRAPVCRYDCHIFGMP